MARKKKYVSERIVEHNTKKVRVVGRYREYRNLTSNALEKIVVMFGNKNMVIKPAEALVLQMIFQDIEGDLIQLYEDVPSRVQQLVVPLLDDTRSSISSAHRKYIATEMMQKITGLNYDGAFRTVEYIANHGFREWVVNVWEPFLTNSNVNIVSKV